MRALGWSGAAVVFALVLVALLGDAVSPYSFDAQEAQHALEGPSAGHWMGTDALGRDVLARVAEGARISLLLALGSTAFALLVGIIYGAVAGYAGGRLDAWLMRSVDVVYSLPPGSTSTR